MRFRVIVADPPWNFGDKLRQSSVKRGAEDQYPVMTDQDIIDLDVSSLAMNESVLALWVPSSKLQVGMDCMKSWGFDQKQTWIWVKVKKDPLKIFKASVLQKFDAYYARPKAKQILNETEASLQDVLDFGMGRLFRQTHELVLVGTRGKIYKKLKNKSQRSVFFWQVGAHSEKPEGLQDMLDKMFSGNKLELFARRARERWTCAGNELDFMRSEDIRISIKKLSSASTKELAFLHNAKTSKEKMHRLWAAIPF